MKHLKKKEISILKDRLNEVRDEILGDVKKTIDHRKDTGADGIQDIADQAADSYFKQVLMDLGERERGRFKEIQDAFERMENGTYVICEETEDEIPSEITYLYGAESGSLRCSGQCFKTVICFFGL